MILSLLKESETETSRLLVVFTGESDELSGFRIENSGLELSVILQSSEEGIVSVWLHHVADSVVPVYSYGGISAAPLNAEMFTEHLFVIIEAFECFIDLLRFEQNIFNILVEQAGFSLRQVNDFVGSCWDLTFVDSYSEVVDNHSSVVAVGVSW